MKKTLPLFLMAIALALSTWSAGGSNVTAMPFQEGKALYAQKCASCHALDGSGNTAKGKEMKLKDLRSPEVQKLSDAKLYELIAKGVKKMPGYEKQLGKEKCQALVAYTRALAKK
jgi:mono/diheme cytochrome c family protein